MRSARISSILLSSVLCLTPTAFAENFYGAFSLGKSDIDLGISGIDDDDTTFAIAGGYRANNNFSAEVGYVDFGEIKISGNGTAELEADAIQLSAIGMLPLSEQFGLMGRIGIDLWDVTLTYSNVPGFGSGKESDDGSDLFVGVGAFVKLGSNADLRIEYQFHELDDVDVDTLTLGLSLSF